MDIGSRDRALIQIDRAFLGGYLSASEAIDQIEALLSMQPYREKDIELLTPTERAAYHRTKAILEAGGNPFESIKGQGGSAPGDKPKPVSLKEVSKAELQRRAKRWREGVEGTPKGYQEYQDGPNNPYKDLEICQGEATEVVLDPEKSYCMACGKETPMIMMTEGTGKLKFSQIVSMKQDPITGQTVVEEEWQVRAGKVRVCPDCTPSLSKPKFRSLEDQ